jgi:hypothetical protein
MEPIKPPIFTSLVSAFLLPEDESLLPEATPPLLHLHVGTDIQSLYALRLSVQAAEAVRIVLEMQKEALAHYLKQESSKPPTRQ